jgi:hypothetical protein
LLKGARFGVPGPHDRESEIRKEIKNLLGRNLGFHLHEFRNTEGVEVREGREKTSEKGSDPHALGVYSRFVPKR